MNYITQVMIDRYNKYTDVRDLHVSKDRNIVCGEEVDKILLDSINSMNSETLIIVFGIGNGECVDKILKRIGKFNRLFVIEPDIEKFYKFINMDKYKEIIEDPRLYLYVYKEKWELWDWLNNLIDEKQFNNIKLVTYSNYDKVYPDILVDVLKTIRDMLNKEWLNFNTAKKLGMKFMKAYIKNLKIILESKPISEIKNSMQGVPAIIVSGGPSLKKNIDKLKDYQNNVVIICGTRTLEPLLQRGIIPDYICVLDTSDAMFELTEGLFYDNIPIVFQQSTNNKILENHKGEKIFFKNNAFETYIDEMLNYPMDKLYVGGSVAHTSADFGVYLGCNPIIFIGQDLALTNNEQYAFENKRIPGGYNNDNILVTDINGMSVETSISLDDFRVAFENYIRIKENITFIDSTEGGAKIEGTLILSLEDTLKLFANDIFKNAFMKNNNNINQYYYDKDMAIGNLERILEVYKKVESKCKSGIKICNKIQEGRNEEEVLAKMKKIASINKYIEECEELDFIDYATNSCLTGSFTLFGFNDKDESKIDESKKVAANFKFIYEYFLKCFKELTPMLKNSIDGLKTEEGEKDNDTNK